MPTKVVEAARKHVEEITRSNLSLDALREQYRRLASLEAKVGNFDQAGKIAEEVLKDYQWAAELYEKANLYHRAIALVSKDNTSGDDLEVKRKLASLHKNGGNLVEAAHLYEELQEYLEAASIYEELEQYRKALECYWKTGEAGREHVIELSCKCGRAEDAVNLLLESNVVTDVERAKNLARNYQLPELEQKAAEILEKLQNGCIDKARECLVEVDKELKETYSPYLGIDFGTTNSVGALFNKKNQTTEIIPVPGSSDGYCEPSCWGVDEQGNYLYGEAARRYGILHAGHVVCFSKRVLGVRNSDVTLQGRKYRPEEIAALIIDHVRQNALVYLQEWRRNRLVEMLHQKQLSLSKEALNQLVEENKPNELLQKAILTVPAFYDSARKQATRTAAEIAGVEVVRLIHEPTAAAIKYFLGKNASKDETKAVVVDLGGGTLDLSFMEIGDGVTKSKVLTGIFNWVERISTTFWWPMR